MTIEERMTQLVEDLQREGMTLQDAADTFDALYVRAALEACKGNISRAAQRIGLHRNTILNRLRENESLRVKPKLVRRLVGFDRWKGGRRAKRRGKR